MKIAMLIIYGFTEEDQNNVSVVGVFPDNTDDLLIRQLIFQKYGSIVKCQKSIHSNFKKLCSVGNVLYEIDGDIDIHHNIEVSGLLNSPLTVY